mgnify:CR=1 FL=1
MFLATVALLLQQGAVTPPPSPPDTIRRTVRRRAVTTELAGSAFADGATRELVALARRARTAQDSALRSYEAKTNSRLSVGLGTAMLMRNRLLFRHEHVSRVRWRRGQGMWIEPLAKRATSPGGAVSVAGFADQLVPLPYYPGKETLWLPGASLARQEVDEEQGFAHPLATGSEAYYRYATGDSIRFALPNGDRITLREVRVTARKPEWRSFVGSFWFDARSGQLVRAAYRMSAPLEIWNLVDEESKREIADAMRDTTKERDAKVKRAKDDRPPVWVQQLTNPMRFDMTLVTTEYSLHEGRFWLPRVNRAEGYAQVTFMRMPITVEEGYKYETVNGDMAFPPLPPAVTDSAREARTINIGLSTSASPEQRDSVRDARRERARMIGWRYSQLPADSARLVDSLVDARKLASREGSTDSVAQRRLRRVRDSLTYALRDSARRLVRERSCRETGFYTRQQTRFDGALTYAVREPCNSMSLLTSKELPPSPYDPNEEAFSMRDAQQLAAALDLSLVPMWNPQPPTFELGANRVRYNRVEGLSWGPSASMVLGRGYTARAEFRVGLGDWSPNGEVGVLRTNGRTTIGGAVFRRLRTANDFGDPLSFGAGLGALLYGRDEGLYFRAWGAEATWERASATGSYGVRAFAERQDGARANWNFAVIQDLGSSVAIRDIPVREGAFAGLGAHWRTSRGQDPRGWRLLAELRGEAGAGEARYARGLGEATLSKRFASWLGTAVTGSAGTATDDVPPQRAFYVGGLRTVRGQLAGTQAGDAFWFTRSEVTWRPDAGIRPSLFYDAGWAGARSDFTSPGRPMSGFGAGLSILDGAIRFDLSRGVHPRQLTRFDMSLEARF